MLYLNIFNSIFVCGLLSLFFAASAAAASAAAADAALQYSQGAGIRSRDSATTVRCASIELHLPLNEYLFLVDIVYHKEDWARQCMEFKSFLNIFLYGLVV